MSKPQRIFILGHMGAGKSLFAQALATKLNWQYIDANPSLERYIGRSLQDILGAQGEAAFHSCEAEIISHYKKKTQVVIVLEESVIATEENRNLLASEYVIYLKVSTQEQMIRMKDGRKFLLPIDNLEAFLDKQHAERDTFFEKIATHTLESISVEDDVERIIQVLEAE